MKKIIYYFILSGFIIAGFSSCDWLKIDNYDQPDQTICGTIIDINHPSGPRPLLTDQGSEGVRIRLIELSWSLTSDPFYFWCMKEGIYQNTKIFPGFYNVLVDGPFIPLVRINQAGDTLANGSKNIDIRGGTTVLDFDVEPFLRVEWAGEPTVSEGVITCKFVVTRGVSVERFRQLIEPMGGWNNNFTELFSLFVFVSESPYVGYREGRNYWTQKDFSGNDFETEWGFGNTITLTSSGKIPPGHTVWVRCGARIRYQTQGIARPNYNIAKRVDIPR